MTAEAMTEEKTEEGPAEPTLTEQLAAAQLDASNWQAEAKRLEKEANDKLAALAKSHDALARKLQALRAVLDA